VRFRQVLLLNEQIVSRWAEDAAAVLLAKKVGLALASPVSDLEAENIVSCGLARLGATEKEATVKDFSF
jgi:hypothetical protein